MVKPVSSQVNPGKGAGGGLVRVLLLTGIKEFVLVKTEERFLLEREWRMGLDNIQCL